LGHRHHPILATAMIGRLRPIYAGFGRRSCEAT
jgi:hypothetical protein